MSELQRDNIQLVLISIGVPEKARDLVQHLDVFDGILEKASMHFFVDPDNSLYDALELNRGVKNLFFNVATPYAFLERIRQKDGLKDIIGVLSKWNRASYLPPKQKQALLQGGTFVFYGKETLFAHYDPSTAVHANIDVVIDIARQPNQEMP